VELWVRKRNAGLMNQTETERRNAKRFRLRLAVVFSWRDEYGILQSGEGRTCNISSRGIYVRTRCAPLPGNTVEMNVFLPQPAYDIHAAEIHAKGQVTRVDQGPRNEVCGFAAMNRTVLIREPIEPALNEKDGAKNTPRGTRQRNRAKHDIGLRRY
jgi:hypothetical protein